MRRALILWNILSPGAFILLWAAGHFWIGLAPLFAGHMAALFATLNPGCSWWGPVRTDFPDIGQPVWLTFDDGPDPDDTPWILEQLRRRDLKAAFFLIGENALRHPDLVRAILADGHLLGNHTQTHPQFSFWRLMPRAVRREIADCSAALAKITGSAPALFRPPAGHKNLFVHPALEKLGLRLMGWTVRGFDGSRSDPQAVLRRLLSGITPGSVVLLHEGRIAADGTRLIQSTLPPVLAAVENLARGNAG
jgi:peptidoglycan/xylan/chitin deacetylase (PgdA/CDA1 family)